MKLALIAAAAIPAQTANSIQTMKMAQAFAGLGHSVRVFVRGEDPGLSWKEIAHHYGLTRRLDLHWLPNRPIFRHYDFALSAVAKGQNWEAEFIYTRLPQAAALAARRGAATIFELHDLPTGFTGPRLMRSFLRGPGAKRLVVITRALARALQTRYSLPGEKDFLLVAPDGVDLDRYEKLPTPKAARQALRMPEAFTVGYTGHLYSGRGIELILECARRLPAMRFLLVGGREEDVRRVQQQARDLQNLQLTGFVPNAELPRYQAACDLLLMPYGRRVSASSGGDIAPYLSPMKMFEYLACGRPILASDLPVLREVLNRQNALILPVEDVSAWVETIRALQGSDKRRIELSKAAKKSATQYTWENRAVRLLQGFAASAKI